MCGSARQRREMGMSGMTRSGAAIVFLDEDLTGRCEDEEGVDHDGGGGFVVQLNRTGREGDAGYSKG